MKRISLVVVVLTLCALFSTSQTRQVASLPADSIWTSPETQIIDHPGQKFTITVWLNMTTPANYWASCLTYNKTQLVVTQSGFTGQGKSQWSDPYSTQSARLYGVHNATHDYICFQEMLKNSVEKTGTGTLAWIEFQILLLPIGGDIIGEVRLDVEGVFRTEVQDAGLNDIPIAVGKTTYIFEASVGPPEIQVLSPQNLTYTSLPIPLDYTLNETVAWTGYSLNGRGNVTLNGNTTLILQNGHYSLVICANSTRGNMSCSDTVHFTVMLPPLSEIRVLHVSTNMQNEVQRIVNDAGLPSAFLVTQVSLSDFNSGVPASLSNYDVVVLGINDGGEDRGPYRGVYGRLAELENYVGGGGGVVWTHDTLEFAIDYGEDVEVPAGVDFGIGSFGGDVEKVRIVAEHQILHEPFEVGSVGDLVPKSIGPYSEYDHNTGGWRTNAILIMEHASVSQPNNFYLTVNEYGAGRVAVIELGHSMGDSGMNLESTRENRILVNAMYWAAHPCDVAVVGIESMKTGCVPMPTLCLSKPTDIYVTVQNQGDSQQAFNVTLYANTTEIETKNVVMNRSTSMKLVFSWTPSVEEYNWIQFSAVASQVIDETHLADNNITEGSLLITHMGDVTGDGKVDIADLSRVSGAFGSIRVTNSSDPQYGKYRHPIACVTCPHEPNTDITGDSKVDIADLSRTSANFGWHR